MLIRNGWEWEDVFALAAAQAINDEIRSQEADYALGALFGGRR
jgi:hypothetical protein